MQRVGRAKGGGWVAVNSSRLAGRTWPRNGPALCHCPAPGGTVPPHRCPLLNRVDVQGTRDVVVEGAFSAIEGGDDEAGNEAGHE